MLQALAKQRAVEEAAQRQSMEVRLKERVLEVARR